MSDLFAEMGGIPVIDDSGEQVEPGHAVVLSFAYAVADFALAPDVERVMSLAPVQAGFGSALHIGVKQPVDDEERALDPSDFTESDVQFVLARIGCELSQRSATLVQPVAVDNVVQILSQSFLDRRKRLLESDRRIVVKECIQIVNFVQVVMQILNGHVRALEDWAAFQRLRHSIEFDYRRKDTTGIDDVEFLMSTITTPPGTLLC